MKETNEKHDTRFTAPNIDGYQHIGNSAAYTAEQAVKNYSAIFGGELIARKFDPTGTGLIRFAVYLKAAK